MANVTPNIVASFSPNGGTAARIIALIDAAKISIDAAIYELTNPDIATALANASRRGVRVRLIADAPAAATHASKVAVVKNSLASLRLARSYHIMHDKILIIDADSVTTGSYNWTAEAEIGNAENSLTISGSPATTALYQANYDQMWATAA